MNGGEVPKAAYAANRFGFSGGGPLIIPHLISGDKTFFFVNYTGNRSKNGFDDISTVPTMAERIGNFSALGTTINFPNTTTPFPGNIDPGEHAQLGGAGAASIHSAAECPRASGTTIN